jgi:truncated hemoglobin YjbI
MQKAIDTGLATAQNQASMYERAWTLREVIDKVRNDIVPKKAGETAEPPKAGGSTLWDRLGGEAGVKQIVQQVVDLVATDKDVNFDRDGKYPLTRDRQDSLENALVKQISSLTGGPYDYKGEMKKIHEKMGITNPQFGAFMEDFRKVLINNRVKEADGRALLTAMDKMRGDIVPITIPKPAEEVTLKGTVTFQNVPLSDATVTIFPRDDLEAKGLSGKTDKDGKFEIKGASPGNYVVTVDKGTGVPDKYKDRKTSTLGVLIKEKDNDSIKLELR